MVDHNGFYIVREAISQLTVSHNMTKTVWDFEFRFRLRRIICLIFDICDLLFRILHYSFTPEAGGAELKPKPTE
jgi:hypothetical protein